MTKKTMIVKVLPHLWEELQLDDPEMYVRVRNGFYMGYGMEALRRLVTLPADSREVTELNRVAPLMGVSSRDRITRR